MKKRTVINEPKRQHFVPRMLLRNFTNEKGLLYFFNKRFPKKRVLESTSTKLFVENHLYTQYDESGGKDIRVEKFLADIESDCSTVVKKIINAARTGKSPNLTPDEKEIWDLFFCCQLVRVPEMIDPYLNNFDEWVSEIAKEYEERFGSLPAEERVLIEHSGVQARIKHNVRAIAVINYLSKGELLPALGKKGLAIARIQNSKKSFVIGSNPYIKTSDWNHISDRNAEIWLPVAYDISVSPSLSPGIEKLIKIKEDSKIREFNEHIFKRSSLIAGRSRKLIASLAGVRV